MTWTGALLSALRCSLVCCCIYTCPTCYCNAADKLKPAYKVLNFVVGTAQAVGNTYHHYAPGWAPFQFPDSPPTADQTKG